MMGMIRPACKSSHQYTLQFLALFSARAVGAGTVLPYLHQPRSVGCNLHTSPHIQQSSRRDPPPARMKVFYIPNPFKWLHNQMEIAALKREWDPSFEIDSFKFGVKQAVCTVTELVSRRDWGELCGLLTQKAIDKIRHTKWTNDQVNNLILSPESVQVTQINNIALQYIVDRKYCDIDVTVIGTRIPYNTDKHSLIVLEYFARFHREYTEGRLPDWTITTFRLQNFQAIPRKDNS